MIRTVLEEMGNGYALYRIPGIIVTDQGTVLTYYEARRGFADWSAIDICMRKSTDNGKTWSERRVIVDGECRYTINNPVMFADGNTIHFLWLRNYRDLFYQCSIDEGETWSQPQDLGYVLSGYIPDRMWTCAATGPGHGIRLSNGRLLVAVWLGYRKSNICAHGPSVVTTIYSDDHGKTWRRGEVIPMPETEWSYNESALAECSDGSVMINIRNHRPQMQRVLAYSEDGVSDWSEPMCHPQLWDPRCAGGMTNFGTDILFSNCCFTGLGEDNARQNLRIRRSRDDGKTWSGGLLVEPCAGYSDIAVSPKTKKIFCIYESKRPDDGETEKTFPNRYLTIARVDIGELE